MTTLRRETTIQDLLRDLEISDPTETSVGVWDRPEGEMRVAIIHETGHVYASPGDDEEERDAKLLFRLPVERIGVEAAIQAVERHLEPENPGPMRECDMMGCRNLVSLNQGKSVAPGTYLAICDDCAPIVATVR